MAQDKRSTTQHPGPARPDDPMTPNPGDPHPGHPDPAYQSADHPAQQQAAETDRGSPSPRRSGKGPSAAPQQSAQGAGPAQQQSGMPAVSPLGDPSPGDENPRELPPAGSTPGNLSEWRRQRRGRGKGKGSRQQMAQGVSGSPQQSGGDVGPLGDPSPGDESPRELPPRGSRPQRG